MTGTGEKLRVGIAGYGVVGRRRRQCIDHSQHLKIVALSDITFDAEGVDQDGVYRCRHYKDLFSQQLDVLFVGLPNHLASEATITGLQRGCHVFCEKPPGKAVDDILAVREVEEQHPGRKLKYGFNHRYHDSVRETKRIVDSGLYGPIINIRGVYGKSRMIPFDGGWRSERKYAGGGILLDQGIHMLDMIMHFAGEFKEVKSFVSNGYWHHDVEDNAFALLRRGDGCVAMVHSTATQWRHKFRLEVTMREALVELTGILSGSKSYGEETLTLVERDGESIVGSFTERTTSYLDDHSWQDEVDEFASMIVKDRPVRNGSSSDALRAMDLVYRIYGADEAWEEAMLSYA